jgi:LysM repeat protein
MNFLKKHQQIFRFLLLGILLDFPFLGYSQKMTTSQYIESYKDIAIKEMKSYGIPASITLAQGILESAFGNSNLAKSSNNHFGIKCGNWTGEKVYADDDKKNECFRKYNSVEDSYQDHSKFLKNSSRYTLLFDLKTTDYKGWAKGLKKAGYATSPDYAEVLIKIIEDYELYFLDKGSKIKNNNSSIGNAGKEFNGVNLQSINREVLFNNGVAYISAKSGDNVSKIAKDFQMGNWQIYKYNDISKKDTISVNEIIYLKPKKRKASEEFHIVKSGETVFSISQHFGIKVKMIYKKNNMLPDSEVKVGQKLWLKKRKPIEKK